MTSSKAAAWHFSWSYETRDMSAVGKTRWADLTDEQREERLTLLAKESDRKIFRRLVKSKDKAVQALVADSTGPDMFRLVDCVKFNIPIERLSLDAIRGVDLKVLADSLTRARAGEKVAPVIPLRPDQIPRYRPIQVPDSLPKPERRRGTDPKNVSPARRKMIDAVVKISDRPWTVLTDHQKTLRLDKLAAWHERDIFAKDLCEHENKKIRDLATSSTEQDIIGIVRAHKAGIDLSKCSLKTFRKLDIDEELRKIAARNAPTGVAAKAIEAVRAVTGAAPPRNADPVPQASPEQSTADTPASLQAFADGLDKKIVEMTGIKPQPEKAGAAPKEFSRWRDPEGAIPPEQQDFEALVDTASDPFAAKEREAATQKAFEALELQDEVDRTITREKSPGFTKAQLAAIRSKLVVGGHPRMDLEAIATYMLAPSFFAIATGLDPTWWQVGLLDSYDRRLGCLAARQCGKSLVTSRKATSFAVCNPGSTTLIIAPTLRQSSELLLKCAGVAQIAGLKLAGLSQFQLVIGDKQPGAGSRIISLPGSNEDSGASVRGFSADLLIFEEASFLSDAVISAVLPSMAARPKAQLVGISSAGLVGSYFYDVMTGAGSRWTRMMVRAADADRFTPEQLEEMKTTLGSRYEVEMNCKWGTVGASLYDESVIDAAFGNVIDGQPLEAPLDPDAAYGWLDLEEIFTARPFEKAMTGASLRG